MVEEQAPHAKSSSKSRSSLKSGSPSKIRISKPKLLKLLNYESFWPFEEMTHPPFKKIKTHSQV